MPLFYLFLDVIQWSCILMLFSSDRRWCIVSLFLMLTKWYTWHLCPLICMYFVVSIACRLFWVCFISVIRLLDREDADRTWETICTPTARTALRMWLSNARWVWARQRIWVRHSQLTTHILCGAPYLISDQGSKLYGKNSRQMLPLFQLNFSQRSLRKLISDACHFLRHSLITSQGRA